MSKNWYILHTYTGYEGKIERTIKSLLEKFPTDKNAGIDPEVVIDVRENNEKTIEYFTALIDHIEEYAGVNDGTTIIDYRGKLLPEWMADNGYEVLLNNEFTEPLIKRWVYGIKEPNIGTIKKSILKTLLFYY